MTAGPGRTGVRRPVLAARDEVVPIILNNPWPE